MVSYLAKIAGVAALALPVVFGAPAPSPLNLKLRNPAATEVVPNKYIVVYEKDVAASAIASHISTITSLISKRKRDFSLGAIATTYAIGEFKGYAVTADEATMAEIAAKPEVSTTLLGLQTLNINLSRRSPTLKKMPSSMPASSRKRPARRLSPRNLVPHGALGVSPTRTWLPRLTSMTLLQVPVSPFSLSTLVS